MSQRALQTINPILDQLIRTGARTENMSLYVSATAQLADKPSLLTQYGNLDIVASRYIPKGYAYIRGKWDRGPMAFKWVSKGTN